MSASVIGALAAILAAVGAYLLFSSLTGANRPPVRRSAPRQRLAGWIAQAGLGEVSGGEFAAAVALMGLVGAAAGFLLFGSLLPAIVGGALCAGAPVSTYRARRRQRMEAAAEAWPRLLEELRLRTGTLGRSVPQALFEAGRSAPPEWRPAFGAAEREWLLTTDFGRTTELLKDKLADPTVDVVCETLFLAHEVGGTDLDPKLADLIEDRVLDLQSRKDAASRQAGVRFARRFVLLVPLGMALAGLSIGSGRSAYESVGGQIAVVIGLIAVLGCWLWSGRLMRLPDEPRVFR